MRDLPETRNKWLSRIGWLIAIWAGSVLALAVFAYGMRLLMSFAGMTT
ncbi:DUF2474 domain-containing protein [Martelella limonii]|nr:DUF2474 domain-containing protein [Martelella limonii]